MVLSELQTKQIEREAKSMVDGMRAYGVIMTKDDLEYVLSDLIEISLKELKAGRPLLAWLKADSY